MTKEKIEKILEKFDEWSEQETATFSSDGEEEYNIEFNQLEFYDELRKKVKFFIISALTKQLEEIRDEIDKLDLGLTEESFKTLKSYSNDVYIGYGYAIVEFIKIVRNLISNKLKELK